MVGDLHPAFSYGTFLCFLDPFYLRLLFNFNSVALLTMLNVDLREAFNSVSDSKRTAGIHSRPASVDVAGLGQLYKNYIFVM